MIATTSQCKLSRQILLQEMEDLICLRSIDINLAEDGERDAILVLGKLFYILIGARFLLSKLIAWKCQDLKRKKTSSKT